MIGEKESELRVRIDRSGLMLWLWECRIESRLFELGRLWRLSGVENPGTRLVRLTTVLMNDDGIWLEVTRDESIIKPSVLSDLELRGS